MSAADESQKAKKQCVVFEPQAWRKSLCRNCFKTKNDHASSSDADDQQKKPTSPVVDDGDVVILRREGTPLKDSSRSGTPTPSATPATTPTTTPAGKKIVTAEQDTSLIVEKETDSGIRGASSDKGKDKAINKTCPEVDKNKTSTSTDANTVKSEAANLTGDGKDELQKADHSSTSHVNHEESDDGKTSNVDSVQCADSQPATAAQQSSTAALSKSAENNKTGSAVDIQGNSAASEAPTSAAGPVAVGEAVNSSAAIKSPDEDGAQTSVPPQRRAESPPAEPSHHGNASSPDVVLAKVGQIDIQTVDDNINTRMPASDENERSSSTVTKCIDDASAPAVAASTAASVANSRGSETSDEIIGDVARFAAVGATDDTKIDGGSGERLAADSTVGEDVVATEPGAGLDVNTSLSEDSQAVRQLDLTPDQATGIPGVHSDLFTNDDLAKSVDDGSDAVCGASISLATAVGDAGGASVEQRSPDLLVDIAPEVTLWDNTAGHAKVETTITLSGSFSPYVADNSRPIHVVSAAGISGYQRGGGSGSGVWTSDASQNVENFVSAERGRLPPDYEPSAGYSSSSVSDDDYGSTSPLVEYLSRSPFARSLHGATERSPETEIVATGGGGETSLFHHVPADSDESATAAGVSNDTRDWEAEQSRNGCSVRLVANSDTDTRYSPGGSSGPGNRRRRRRIISGDDAGPWAMMNGTSASSTEAARCEAMMEGKMMLIDSLRDKVAALEDRCEKMDREKMALSDLLVSKKSDYDRMKTHCSDTISELEDEVQRLKSEKARLLDRLQLPESERASLAAEENEIAELKSRIDDYEVRYGDVVAENDDLQQEVRDLQLAMAELHDQFRDEETVELRELQRELEATAKACRIAQFKLRKADRHCDQLEAEKAQAEERVRCLENCVQGSDDKRRLRLMEEELRMAKEATVRLHDDLMRAEERRQRHQDDLDRVKNTLNESESRRLCLQNQYDNAQTELQKLREQLKFEGRLDLLKPCAEKLSESPDVAGLSGYGADVAAAAAQLSRDLAASEEREQDLHEQLRFAEEANKTLRKKLSDSEEEIESINLQLRKLSSAKRGVGNASRSTSKTGSGVDVEPTQREVELGLQMELAEQEIGVLQRKLDAVNTDNENLLTAVKYLRAKLEPSTSKSDVDDVVARLMTNVAQSLSDDELDRCRDELSQLRQRVAQVEVDSANVRSRTVSVEGGTDSATTTVDVDETTIDLQAECDRLRRLVDELQRRQDTSTDSSATQATTSATDTGETIQLKTFHEEKEQINTEKTPSEPSDTQTKIEELEKSLSEERKKLEAAVADRQKTETELNTYREETKKQLTSIKADLKKSQDEGAKVNKELEATKTELKKLKDCKVKLDETQKQLDALKKKSTDVEAELKRCQNELKTALEQNKAVQTLQKSYDELKKNYDSLTKESKEKEPASKSSAVQPSALKDKEPASWRWDKQELERQVKDWKKKYDDLVQSSTDAKKDKEKVTLKPVKFGAAVSTNNKANGECSVCGKDTAELRGKLDQLQQEKDAILKEKEALLKEKDKKEDPLKQKDGTASKPKLSFLGKETSELTEKTKAVQDLTAKLDKKETEIKSVKAEKSKLETETKKAQDKVQDLQQKLDKATADWKKEVSDAASAYEKLQKELEPVKTKLSEQDDKVQSKTLAKKTTATAAAANDDSKKLLADKEILTKEKQKLTEEVNKLKKEMTDVERQRKSEKEELEKNMKEKAKQVEKLQTELDSLKSQAESSKTKTSGSKVVVVPVQQEKAGSKTTPKNGAQPSKADQSAGMSPEDDLSSRIEKQERLFQSEKSNLEELHRSKVRALEEQVNRCKDQLKSQKKDSDAVAAESKKALADVKSRYERELATWNKERETMNKNDKQVEEYKSRISVLDKSIDDLTGKLKAEEGKRKELENRVKQLSNESQSTKTVNKAEEKPASKTLALTNAGDDKTGTQANPKMSGFRSKFEKFGGSPATGVVKPGTPAPFRRNSAAADVTAAAATADKSSSSSDAAISVGKDLLGDLQKQLADAEKTRVKDRQELIDKLAAQKKEFDAELQEMKKKNKQLDQKAHELSEVQKNVVELRCEMDTERSKWLTDKSQLQADLDDALKDRDEEREKAAQLNAEVVKLRVLAGLDSQQATSSTTSDSAKSKTGAKTSSPVVIPVKRVGADDKKTATAAGSKEAASNESAAAANDAKPARKLFSPMMAEASRTFGAGEPVKVTPAPSSRTIPITRINRPGTPKV